MSKFNVTSSVALICWVVVVKIALIIAVAAIAVALLSGAWNSRVYADSPLPSDARASQSTDDASQALRRYTLQLLHILSDADSNKWERYRQAMPHCDAAPTYLAESGDVGPLEATLAELIEDLCADLDRRLDEARTVGLLVNEPEAMLGYTLITGRFSTRVRLIDNLGRIVNEWRFRNWVRHAKLLDNGNLLAELRDGRGSFALGEIDPDGNIVWEYAHHENLHHDFLKMPNGNVLMLAQGVKTREEAISAGANPDAVPAGGMEYDYLIEVRSKGNEDGDIVWEWSSWDYIVQTFDATKENYGNPSEYPELIDINFLAEVPHTHIRPRKDQATWDWLHINAIDYNPALDQIMLSPRQHNELWIIDRSASTEEAPTRKGGNASKGGALLYRWGNPHAYGHGTAANRRLFWQHHTQWIAPGLPGAGNILLFNNGSSPVEDQNRGYSSIEEIIPPLDGYGYRRDPGAAYPPAEPIWTYTAETPTDFYSVIISGVQRLPNGNTLICEGTSGNVFQVTPDGKTVWRYVYPMDGNTPLKQGGGASIWHPLSDGDILFSNAVYRAYWYAPDHPGLRKYDLTPGDTIELYE